LAADDLNLVDHLARFVHVAAQVKQHRHLRLNVGFRAR
jgi:hypothetical protein